MIRSVVNISNIDRCIFLKRVSIDNSLMALEFGAELKIQLCVCASYQTKTPLIFNELLTSECFMVQLSPFFDIPEYTYTSC